MDTVDPSFSEEEVCGNCEHTCCFKRKPLRLNVPDFEIWDCFECDCHYNNSEPYESFEYQRYLDEKWGD